MNKIHIYSKYISNKNNRETVNFDLLYKINDTSRESEKNLIKTIERNYEADYYFFLDISERLSEIERVLIGNEICPN